MLAFKYWYTEPTARGRRRQPVLLVREPPDHLPRDRVPGRPGVPGRHVHQRRAHRRRAPRRGPRADPGRGSTRRSRFGFTEWHSDVYYQKDATPLLTLVEFAHDPEDRQPRRDGARPAAVRRRAAPPAGQLRRRPRPSLHEGQERRRGPGRVRPGEAALRRHRAALREHGRRRRGPVRPGAEVPAARGASAGSRRPTPTTVDRERMGVPLDPPAPITADPSRRTATRSTTRERPVLVGARRRRPRGRSCRPTIESSTATTSGTSNFFSPFKPLARPRSAATPTRPAPSPSRSRRCSASAC